MEVSHWTWPSQAQVVCSKCLPASCGSLPHVAFLIDEYLMDDAAPSLLQEACEHGAPLYILEFLLRRMTPNWAAVVASATRGRHLHVFEWMTGRTDGRGPWGPDFRECLECAAAHGHLDLVKWLHNRGTPACNISAFHRAARNNHLAVVQWLHEHTDAECHVETIGCVMQRGHFEVARWLHGNVGMARTECAMRSAARYGQLEILQWLHQRTNCAEVCTKSVMNAAFIGGHLNVAKWLLDHCSKGCSSYGLDHAAKYGYLPILQWADTHFSDQFDSSVMNEAACGGHLEVVQWLHEHRSEGCTTRAMDTAARHGHMDVIEWLHANRSEGCSQYAMDWALELCQLDAVKWLHENKSLPFFRSAMYFAARDGTLEMIKWLSENGAEVDSRSLVVAATGNKLDIVRYLEGNWRMEGSRWGLAAAAEKGRLHVLLVLIENKYLDGTSAHYTISVYCGGMLRQISAHHAHPASSLWQEALGWMEKFHRRGVYSCTCAMLSQALKQGYVTMARQFFKLRTEQEKRRYVEIAGQMFDIVVVRWLIENGTPLDTRTALKLIRDRFYEKYIESLGWLSERDRVALVCKELENYQSNLLLWMLENTAFDDENPRDAIRAAINLRGDDPVERLAKTLRSPKARSWCLPVKEEPMDGAVVRPTKRRRLS